MVGIGGERVRVAPSKMVSVSQHYSLVDIILVVDIFTLAYIRKGAGWLKPPVKNVVKRKCAFPHICYLCKMSKMFYNLS